MYMLLLCICMHVHTTALVTSFCNTIKPGVFACAQSRKRSAHRVRAGFFEVSNLYKIRPNFKASNFYKIRA